MNEIQDKLFEVVIIGSGPAGRTASFSAVSLNLAPLALEWPEPGGKLMKTTDVENFPWYPEGVIGPRMMEDFREQAKRFGADCRYGFVTEIGFDTRPFKITVDDEYTVYAKSIIVATGASAKWLNIPSEEKLKGKGVSACATCEIGRASCRE